MRNITVKGGDDDLCGLGSCCLPMPMPILLRVLDRGWKASTNDNDNPAAEMAAIDIAIE